MFLQGCPEESCVTTAVQTKLSNFYSCEQNPKVVRRRAKPRRIRRTKNKTTSCSQRCSFVFPSSSSSSSRGVQAGNADSAQARQLLTGRLLYRCDITEGQGQPIGEPQLPLLQSPSLFLMAGCVMGNISRWSRHFVSRHTC